MKCRVGRVCERYYQLLLVWLPAFVVGCAQSRYDSSLCGVREFPAPEVLLSEPYLDRLTFFRTTVGRIPGEPSMDMWADGKFDHDTGLTYRYEATGERGDLCVVSVSLMARQPVSEVGIASAETFVSAFGPDTDTWASIVDVFRLQVDAETLYEASVSRSERLVADVTRAHHPFRGDFVVITFYLPEFYDLIASRQTRPTDSARAGDSAGAVPRR